MSNLKSQRETKVAIEIKGGDFESWYRSLYNVQDITIEELQVYYDALKYKGFDRMKQLLKLSEKVKEKKELVQLVLLCALQGPIRAAKTKLLNGTSPTEMGIPASGQKQTENLSCARITSSTADLAAYYMKALNVPKRLVSHPCPAWLQFPAAGSIKLPDQLRELHIDFSKKFSILIGGQFNESIYQQMVNNAYLDPALKLFE
jgi:hypothetical protein